MDLNNPPIPPKNHDKTRVISKTSLMIGSKPPIWPLSERTWTESGGELLLLFVEGVPLKLSASLRLFRPEGR